MSASPTDVVERYTGLGAQEVAAECPSLQGNPQEDSLSYHDPVDHDSLLAEAIYGLESPFITTGVCDESDLSAKPITIDYKRKDGQSASISFPQAPASDRNVNPPKEKKEWTNEQYKNVELTPQFSAFLDDCEPSPFGHGSQTVFDSSVRRAMQIPGSRIDRASFLDTESGRKVLKEVQRQLVPTCGVPIEATLDKLNVYGEGGHFKVHRDTPRDERCFGTLVVCLPSSFAGGRFDIWHNPTENAVLKLNWEHMTRPRGTEYDYANKILRSHCPKEAVTHIMMTGTPPLCVQWAAFFGDCEHQISEVTAGYRITLTYILRYSEVGGGIGEPARKMARTVGSELPSTSNAGSSSSSASATASVSSAPLPAPPAQAPAPPPRPDYSKMTVAMLKDICRSRGLTVGGKKDCLIDRLEAADLGISHGFSSSPSPAKRLTMYPDQLAMLKGRGLYTTLRNALADPDFKSEGCVLGVPCFHMYERASDVPSSVTQQYIQGTDLRLKGADAFVYLAAARLGLSPRIFTIMTDSCCEETVALCPAWPGFEGAISLTSPTMIEDSFLARGLDIENVQLRKGTMEIGDNKITYDDLSTIDWVIDLPVLGDRYSSADDYPAQPVPIIDCWSSATGYFGNEASETTVYANAVIAIPVPPYEERCSNPELFIDAEGEDSSPADALQAFAFFKGTKAPDSLPEEEDNLARKRFDAFSTANRGFSLPELRQLAADLGVSSKGTAGMLASRINKAMDEDGGGGDDDCDGCYDDVF